MIKKVFFIFIIITSIFICLSCSASITSPSENENVGDGNLISQDVAITDEASINRFLEMHNGIYYATYEDGSLDMRYRIEGTDIFNGYGTQINATRTLFGSKLQIYIPGTGTGYSKNDEMYTFNFGPNGNIYLFANAIFDKEPYSQQPGYTDPLGEPISELSSESGKYYYYDYDDSKKYYIIIDNNGQIYIDNNFKITYSKAYLTQNLLTISYTQSGGTTTKQNLHFYNGKLIYGNTWINNQLQYETLKKYALLTPYSGIYTDGNITLTVNSQTASVTGVSYGTPVIVGNTLTIYKYSSRYGTETHKFVFTSNKQTVLYTKPDKSTTVTLTKKS